MEPDEGETKAYRQGLKDGANAEREACAKVADAQAAHASIFEMPGNLVGAKIGRETSEVIAQAIRNRKEK